MPCALQYVCGCYGTHEIWLLPRPSLPRAKSCSNASVPAIYLEYINVPTCIPVLSYLPGSFWRCKRRGKVFLTLLIIGKTVTCNHSVIGAIRYKCYWRRHIVGADLELALAAILISGFEIHRTPYLRVRLVVPWKGNRTLLRAISRFLRWICYVQFLRCLWWMRWKGTLPLSIQHIAND